MASTLGITAYRLFPAEGLYYTWEVGIRTLNAGHYRFTDMSNDTYGLSVLLSGDHYVRYNSDLPNIKHVEWRA